jgi:ribosomal protein S18 acetylase RimI-like enzyme
MNVKIEKAKREDLNEVLELQYLAYQSEAALFGTNDIPPLRQTLDEVVKEYNVGTILKMVDENGIIIGSVRAKENNDTVYIGKLMVHPDYRGNGFGTKLLSEIEHLFPNKRYELFTSTRSVDNIRLYQKSGYKIFSERIENDELTFVYMEK